jgi:trans-aconitate 2-methyltransferase
MGDWSATQYLRFEDERTRPAADLLARVGAERPGLVVDLGCGPGNSTELLLRRFPGARVVGVDTAPDMLAAARSRLPAVSFVAADVETWAPEDPCDVIFANAVLQWLPHHARLFPRLIGLLAPGGWLAVQMPDNLDEPTHSVMREVAQEGPWASRLGGATRGRLPGLDAYFDLLRPASRHVDIWRTTYVHVLPDSEAVVQWVLGTGLRPYLAPLSAAERDNFLARYRTKLTAAYPPRSTGEVLLPFPRLFIVSQSG